MSELYVPFIRRGAGVPVLLFADAPEEDEDTAIHLVCPAGPECEATTKCCRRLF